MSEESILKSAARGATSSSFAMVISNGSNYRIIPLSKTVIELPIGAFRVVAGTLFSVKKRSGMSRLTSVKTCVFPNSDVMTREIAAVRSCSMLQQIQFCRTLCGFIALVLREHKLVFGYVFLRFRFGFPPK